MKNALKMALSTAAIALSVPSLAQSITFSGFAHGSQDVRGVLISPNVSHDLTVRAGGFDTQFQGASFVSYCVDFYQWLPSFGSSNNSYSEVNAANFFGDRLDEIELLFSGRFSQVDTAVEEAAFQIALWEIRYEAPGQTFNTLSGSARFSDVGDDARGLAQTYLNGLSSYERTMTVRVLGSGTNQDVVFAAPVPEPSTYALMLAGLAGVALVARRRSRRD
jgi:hypothetical protein